METCKARRLDGTPCHARPTSSGFCLAHDAMLEDQRNEARRRGGRNSSSLARARKAAPPGLGEVQALLLEALRATRDGTLAPRQAAAIATLAAATARVFAIPVEDVAILSGPRVSEVEDGEQ